MKLERYFATSCFGDKISALCKICWFIHKKKWLNEMWEGEVRCRHFCLTCAYAKNCIQDAIQYFNVCKAPCTLCNSVNICITNNKARRYLTYELK